MRILVVEDDPMLTEILQVNLSGEGYAVDSVSTGEEGEGLAVNIPYDLILLDIVLPGKDGFEVCSALRNKNINTPIIMLSAKKKNDSDVIHGLDNGADEYILKPFRWEIVSAKIRTALRKMSITKNPRLEIGDFVLDSVYRQVWQGQKEITLTAKEYAIFEYLARHSNTIITRVELEQHVWNIEFDSSSNIVDQHIRNLRMKLGDANLIETIRGKGYRLNI